ncbi:MAG TPA: hypothetical protein PLY70_00145 [Saprospiraceae bacterium]|nr:hypothetical protein [Saprospiraceae bacterium]HPN70722.1 hypothetical protein [Saprospiraceae bacterium]
MALNYKISRHFIVVFIALGSLLLLSNREGRDVGNANAPGETGTTCLNCHIRGPYTPVFDLLIRDGAGNRVSYYLPGQQYSFEVRVADVSAKAKTFGFQVVPLDEDDNFVGTWSQLGSRVRKIKDLGREYLTHSAPSSTGIFKAVWTAPEKDLGNITFYLAGVTADGEGASIGDNSDTTKFIIPSLTSDLSNIKFIPLEVFPSITSDRINVLLDSDLESLLVFDIHGKLVKQFHDLPLGNFPIDVIDFGAGSYFIQGFGKDGIKTGTARFLKF